MDDRERREIDIAAAKRALVEGGLMHYKGIAPTKTFVKYFAELVRNYDVPIWKLADELLHVLENAPEAMARSRNYAHEQKSRLDEFFMPEFPEVGDELAFMKKALDENASQEQLLYKKIRTALYLCLGYMERGMENFSTSKLYTGLKFLKLSDKFGPSKRRIPQMVLRDIEASHLPTNTVVFDGFDDNRLFHRYFLVQPGNGNTVPVRSVAYETDVDALSNELLISRRELPACLHGDIMEMMRNYNDVLPRVVRAGKDNRMGYFVKTSKELCDQLNGLMLEKKVRMPRPDPMAKAVTEDVLYI